MAISRVRSISQPLQASMASCTRPCSAINLSISSGESSSPKRALMRSNASRRSCTGRTPSSTLPRTVLAGSSSGSCGRYPTRTPSAGQASPRKSLTTPAMIFRRVLLPAPLEPISPILAPGRNDSQMFFRTSRFGG